MERSNARVCWRRALPYLLAASLIGVGCATGPPLKPNVGAQVMVGKPESAVGRTAGVTVVADADAWRAFPRHIGVAIPMRVRIQNDSGHPLLIRYRDFALQAPTGERLAAVRPMDIRGRTWVTLDYGYPGPYAGGSGFYVGGGPAYGPYYGGPWGWGGWGGYGGWGGWGGWGYWAPPSVPVELPTQDMLVRAIPEGVLQPGATVDGFIYFETVPKDVESVTFTYQLLDANSREVLGTVQIPFASS